MTLAMSNVGLGFFLSLHVFMRSVSQYDSIRMLNVQVLRGNAAVRVSKSLKENLEFQ